MLAEEMLMHEDAHLHQTNICKYAKNKILEVSYKQRRIHVAMFGCRDRTGRLPRPPHALYTGTT